IERGREEAVAEGERAHRLARRRERDLHRGNVARLRRASQQPAVPDARRRGRDLEWTVLHQADRAGADRREVGCRVQPVREQLQIPMTRMFRLATAFVLISCAVARAEVTRVDVARRADVGISGYEKIVGTIHFAVDPKAPRNRLVVDLDKAPVNAAGLVEFSADLYILRPKATPGNGVALVDILNRGNKVVLNGFNRGGSPDPASENDLGDRFLMRFGYTIVWVGWEFDVAARPNAMRVHVPVATDRGKPITGVVQATFTPNGETHGTRVHGSGVLPRRGPWRPQQPVDGAVVISGRTRRADSERSVADRGPHRHARQRVRRGEDLRGALSRRESTGRGTRIRRRPR